MRDGKDLVASPRWASAKRPDWSPSVCVTGGLFHFPRGH